MEATETNFQDIPTKAEAPAAQVKPAQETTNTQLQTTMKEIAVAHDGARGTHGNGHDDARGTHAEKPLISRVTKNPKKVEAGRKSALVRKLKKEANGAAKNSHVSRDRHDVAAVAAAAKKTGFFSDNITSICYAGVGIVIGYFVLKTYQGNKTSNTVSRHKNNSLYMQ